MKPGLPSFTAFAVAYSPSYLHHDECLPCQGHPKIFRKACGPSGLAKLPSVELPEHAAVSQLPLTTRTINSVFLNLHGDGVR